MQFDQEWPNFTLHSRPERKKLFLTHTGTLDTYVARGASGGVCKEEALAAVSAVSTPSLPRCRGEGAGRGPKPSYLDPRPPHVYSTQQ